MEQKKVDLTQTTLRLPSGMLRRLRLDAASKGTSINKIVLRLVAMYLGPPRKTGD